MIRGGGRHKACGRGQEAAPPRRWGGGGGEGHKQRKPPPKSGDGSPHHTASRFRLRLTTGPRPTRTRRTPRYSEITKRNFKETNDFPYALPSPPRPQRSPLHPKGSSETSSGLKVARRVQSCFSSTQIQQID